MKRWKGFVSLLAVLVLTGCAVVEAVPTAEEPAPVQAAPPTLRTEAALPPAEGLSAAQTEAQARPLTEEEILAAYDRAVTAYGWFELTALPCDGEAVTVDGWTYYPVEYPGLKNQNDLQGYLSSLFSEDVTEQLLATGGDHPLYRDVDGRLYTLGGGRRADARKGTVTAQTARTGETAYSVNVTVETLAEDLVTITGLECWSFPYELTRDRWVFTNFDLVY